MKKATIGSRSYVRQNPETHSYLKLEEGDRRDAVCNIVLLHISNITKFYDGAGMQNRESCMFLKTRTRKAANLGITSGSGGRGLCW